MSGSTVKLDFPNNDKDGNNSPSKVLAYWPASHVPVNPKFSFDKTTNKRNPTIVAQDHIQFKSDEELFSDDNYNYFIGSLSEDGKRMKCQTSKLYRMMPCYDFKDHEDSLKKGDSTLTKKEQLDEMKEKFGSRRSQRDLSNKRKYQIQFGDDDVDSLPSVHDSYQPESLLNETNPEGEAKEVGKSETIPLSAILPERNPDATSVDEVYKLSDIIGDVERSAIMQNYDSLLAQVKHDYFVKQTAKFTDENKRIIIIYADLLLQIVKLGVSEMKKPDPLPNVDGLIKKYLFERFTSTKQISSRQTRYIITDQNKDKLYVSLFILLLMLNDYNPLELTDLQTQFKVPVNYIRKLFELIGCYIENMKNASLVNVRVAKFKLPLNVFKEPKMKRTKR